jgi:VanZ family protein
MIEQPPRGRIAVAWAWVVAWSLLIWTSVPFARAILRWTDRHLGADALRWLSIGIIGLAACWAARRIYRRARTMPRRRIALVAVITGLFIYAALASMESPAEAVHFVEYGALGLLVFRALAFRARDPLVYLNAALICALIGVIDESLQWLTPGRYWDARDLAHNSFAAVLALAALAGGLRPPYIRPPIAQSSARVSAALTATLALLLGLCASNTPAATVRWAERFPALAFLLDKEHAMSEYGFRFDDPDIGRFYTRFDRDAVRALDAERAGEVGSIIRQYVAQDKYDDFLRYYTPTRDPFAHEAMVRLYRRNHYFGVLPKYRDEPHWYAFHVTVAWRENQILERYFSNTLEAAGQRWTDELKDALAEHVQDTPYVSPASKHLIHRVSLQQIWAAVLLALAGAAVVWARSGASKRAEGSRPRQEGGIRKPSNGGGRMLRSERTREALHWAAVAGWTAIIYLTIPIGRRIQEWVTEYWTREAFMWIVFAAIAAGLLGAVVELRRRFASISLKQGAILAALATVFGAGTWHLRRDPEEAIHFVQYGVLSLLLLRAYASRYGDRGAFVCAALLGSILGVFDEVIQWAVPQRYFDYRDITINVSSIWLVQAGLAGGLAPRLAAIPAGVRSARMGWRLLRLALLLMLGIVSNTPDVWQPLHSYRPELFVFNESMTEYGHLIKDPAIGQFRSRFTAERLRAADRARAEEAGEILRRSGSDKEYTSFIHRYSPLSDPFLHEMRVRLFRRDRYWKDARANRRDPAKHQEFITVAFGEQRILESYFGHTLRASGRDWPADLRARAEAAAKPGPYDSPVSRELITAWTRRQAQLVLLGGWLVALAAGAYDLWRRGRRASNKPDESKPS